MIEPPHCRSPQAAERRPASRLARPPVGVVQQQSAATAPYGNVIRQRRGTTCVPGPRSSRCPSRPSWSGRIPGTSRRDLPRNDENRRDLNRTSNRMRGVFALVSETLAQDPAYRPTHCGCRSRPASCLVRPGPYRVVPLPLAASLLVSRSNSSRSANSSPVIGTPSGNSWLNSSAAKIGPGWRAGGAPGSAPMRRAGGRARRGGGVRGSSWRRRAGPLTTDRPRS